VVCEEVGDKEKTCGEVGRITMWAFSEVGKERKCGLWIGRMRRREVFRRSRKSIKSGLATLAYREEGGEEKMYRKKGWAYGEVLLEERKYGELGEKKEKRTVGNCRSEETKGWWMCKYINLIYQYQG
jgi:hypothetical protein